jgi:hypothetical protein
MLLSVINARNVDQQLLIYLAFPITLIEDERVVFTDAAANRATAPPAFYTDPGDLSRLDWNAIDCLRWDAGGDAQNHARMAEVLIHTRVDLATASHIIVWNPSVAAIVREIYAEPSLEPPEIRTDTRHYFTKFPDHPESSLVTGPHFTKKAFTDTVARVLDNLGKAKAPRFATLAGLLGALRQDFNCLPETAELDGLLTDNPLHPDDFGTHTRRVADRLRKLPEYATLDQTDKMLVEIAAYLHDIGKGPKGRWAKSGGRYKVDRDHPQEALPMVQRILTLEVADMKRRSARLICKLVCYHDLVGDILGRGRDEEQLMEIVDDVRELDMLNALTKADVLVVHPAWWDDQAAAQLRARIVSRLEAGEA